MGNNFEVSVIIPVYNAEKYVVRAINSALAQAEVKEVIVVDDGYADDAYALCQQIATKEPRVKLFTHPNHENLGAAVSRNLGMLNASSDYIAFLDADDYYLPNRFRFTKETFESNPKIEGVYEPVGTEFSSKEAQQKFAEMMRLSFDKAEGFITYPKKALQGHEFFESLIYLNNGLPPQTDGITIKRSLLASVGLFNSQLRLHQDSEFWIRLSYQGYFATPENREPVSIRTMHDQNRVYAKNNQSKLLYYKSLLAWATLIDMDKNLYEMILHRYKTILAMK